MQASDSVKGGGGGGGVGGRGDNLFAGCKLIGAPAPSYISRIEN